MVNTSNPTVTSVPILITGGGPVGLYEAYLLTRLGIQVRIIERELAICPLSKALGLQQRSLEVFSMTGIIDPFMERGANLTHVDLFLGAKYSSSFGVMDHNDSFHKYPLNIEQAITSEIFTKELEKLGVKVDYGWELLDTKLVETDTDSETGGEAKKTFVESVIRRRISNHKNSFDTTRILGDVTPLEENPDEEYETQIVRSEYLVAADGGRSVVRHKLNIGFPGRTRDFKSLMWDGTYEGEFKIRGIT